MYHYKESGLRKIWLSNGYRTRKTPYGETVSIEDIEGLHRAIAKDLIYYKPRLSGAELRFLRKELDMSQKRLAEILGNDAQSVALWEKNKVRVPKWADRFVRKLYLEYIDSNKKIVELIDKLNQLDRLEHDGKRTFIDTDKGWRPKAA